MSDSSNNLPARQPAKHLRKPRVTGKTKAALDLMVMEGLTDNEAAVRVGITIHAIRLLMKQPHGRAYFRNACDVLRERENPRNIHALIEVRDQKGNQMARVQAARALMQQSEDVARTGGQLQSPGVVVQIITAPALIQHEARIDAKPLITLDHVQDDR